MKVLVVGNMGYIGPVLTKHLRRAHPHAILIGFDAGLFAHCLIGSAPLPEIYLDRQVFGDVRHIDQNLFEGVDAVVNLPQSPMTQWAIDLRKQRSRSTIKLLWSLQQQQSGLVCDHMYLRQAAVSTAVLKKEQNKNRRRWIR